MAIGDYQVEDTEYEVAPPDSYVVYIDDVTADTTTQNPYINVKYKVAGGEHEGKVIFKRYYITAKTLMKFIPWQFGIIGIWNQVKMADTFVQGIEKSIDALGPILGKHFFDADVEVETYESNSGVTKKRNNLVLTGSYGDEKPVINYAPKKVESTFDDTEEIPF
jgi:hypothetical protein